MRVRRRPSVCDTDIIRYPRRSAARSDNACTQIGRTIKGD